MKVLCLCLSLAGAFSVPAVAAEKPPVACGVLDTQINTSVAEYAAAKYHVASVKQLSLKETVRANNDCYWKFQYEVLPGHKTITLYLSPDHKYLLPAIFDRTLDPLAEEKAARMESLRALTARHAAAEGPANSPVTIVEFSDFQCPYCSRLTALLEKEVLPANPDVRVVFRNFPLPMHPWAQSAAQLAACASQQSDAAFWKVHDYIFGNQKEFTLANVTEKVSAFVDTVPGADSAAFHSCVDQELTMGPVLKDVELGKRFDVHATPTVFINGTKVEGIRDAEQLKQLIAQARNGQLSSPAAESAAKTAVAARNQPQTPGACDPAK